jgi:fumarylpyruvate hydrolase
MSKESHVMSKLVFNAPRQVSLPIKGTDDRFPVRRIYCIGRNYAAHTIEMGGDPTRETPFFFLKPIEALVESPYGKTVDLPYPTKTSNYHFEAEMAVCLHKGGKNIKIADALNHVYGYAVCLDMTRRDLQTDAKKAGRPWEAGKSPDHSAPIGIIHKATETGHIDKGLITLTVDGRPGQKANLDHMIWTVSEQISYLSEHFELFEGDIIFTGTPEGVGAVKQGETMTCSIEGLGAISHKLV